MSAEPYGSQPDFPVAPLNIYDEALTAAMADAPPLVPNQNMPGRPVMDGILNTYGLDPNGYGDPQEIPASPVFKQSQLGRWTPEQVESRLQTATPEDRIALTAYLTVRNTTAVGRVAGQEARRRIEDEAAALDYPLGDVSRLAADLNIGEAHVKAMLAAEEGQRYLRSEWYDKKVKEIAGEASAVYKAMATKALGENEAVLFALFERRMVDDFGSWWDELKYAGRDFFFGAGNATGSVVLGSAEWAAGTVESAIAASDGPPVMGRRQQEELGFDENAAATLAEPAAAEGESLTPLADRIQALRHEAQQVFSGPKPETGEWLYDSFIPNLASGAGSMTPYLVGGMFGSPALAGMAYSQHFASMKDSVMAEGATSVEAHKIASVAAVPQAIISAWAAGAWTSKWFSRTLSPLKQSVGGIITSAAEEALDEAVEPVTDWAARSYFKGAMDLEDLTKNILPQSASGAFYGGVLGGLMAGGGATASAVRTMRAEQYYRGTLRVFDSGPALFRGMQGSEAEKIKLFSDILRDNGGPETVYADASKIKPIIEADPEHKREFLEKTGLNEEYFDLAAKTEKQIELPMAELTAYAAKNEAESAEFKKVITPLPNAESLADIEDADQYARELQEEYKLALRNPAEPTTVGQIFKQQLLDIGMNTNQASQVAKLYEAGAAVAARRDGMDLDVWYATHPVIFDGFNKTIRHVQALQQSIANWAADRDRLVRNAETNRIVDAVASPEATVENSLNLLEDIAHQPGAVRDAVQAIANEEGLVDILDDIESGAVGLTGADVREKLVSEAEAHDFYGLGTADPEQAAARLLVKHGVGGVFDGENVTPLEIESEQIVDRGQLLEMPAEPVIGPPLPLEPVRESQLDIWNREAMDTAIREAGLGGKEGKVFREYIEHVLKKHAETSSVLGNIEGMIKQVRGAMTQSRIAAAQADSLAGLLARPEGIPVAVAEALGLNMDSADALIASGEAEVARLRQEQEKWLQFYMDPAHMAGAAKMYSDLGGGHFFQEQEARVVRIFDAGNSGSVDKAVHEGFHFFYQELRRHARNPNAGTRAVEDYKALQREMGVDGEYTGDKRWKFDATPTLSATTDSVASIPDGPKFTARLVKWANDKNLFGVYQNDDTGWTDITVAPSSIRSVNGHAAGPGKLAVLEVLPELIRTGVYLETTQRNEQGHLGHVFAGKVTVDGTEYTIGFTVNEDVNGKKYYNHELVDLNELQKKAPETDIRRTATSQPLTPSREPIRSILNRHLNVKSSKELESVLSATTRKLVENDPVYKEVRSYSSGAYAKDVNAVLRGDTARVNPETAKEEYLKKIDATVKSMDRAIDNTTPLPQGITVYRGMRESYADQIIGLKVGETFVDDGFTSTSLNKDTADRYAKGEKQKGVYVEIHVPEGAKGLYMPSALKEDDFGEREFILPRGGSYTVREITDNRLVVDYAPKQEFQGTTQSTDHAVADSDMSDKSKGEWKADPEERLAEMFVEYMKTGNAPSLGLQGVFRRFKTWLNREYTGATGVYKASDLKMTDEVKGVFDRLIASETEIQEALRFHQTGGMIPSDIDDENREKLLGLLHEANARASEKRMAKLVSTFLEANGGRQEIKKKVAETVRKQPAYKAMDDIRRAGGLRRQDALQFLGNAADLKTLRQSHARLITNKPRPADLQSADLDAIATRRNYADGVAMLDAIVQEAAGPDTSPEVTKAVRELSGKGGVDAGTIIANFGDIGLDNVQKKFPGLIRTESDLNVIAEQNGFDSVEDMLKAIVQAPRLTVAVKHGTDAMVTAAEEQARAITEQEAATKADDAIHNDALTRLIEERNDILFRQALEKDALKEESLADDLEKKKAFLESRDYNAGYRAARRESRQADMARQLAQRGKIRKQIQADARELVSMTAGNKAGQYHLALNKFKKLSGEIATAISKGDVAEAARLSDLQLMAHYEVKESIQARQELEKFAGDMQTRKVVNRLDGQNKTSPKVMDSHSDAYKFLVQGWKVNTDRKLTPMGSPKDTAAGQDINVRQLVPSVVDMIAAETPWIFEEAEMSKITDWRELPMGKIRDLRRALNDIAVAGRNELRGVKDKRYANRNEWKDDILRRMRELPAKKYSSRTNDFFGNIHRDIDALVNAGTLVESWFSEADGFTSIASAGKGERGFGPLQRAFGQLRGGQAAMWNAGRDVNKPVIDKVSGQLASFTQRLNNLDAQYKQQLGPVPEQFRSVHKVKEWSPEMVWAVMLNTGTDANFKAVTEGWGISEAQIKSMQRLFTKEDWNAIQGVWDLLGKKWRGADAVIHRQTNRHMGFEKARPVQVITAEGEIMNLKGGYYPLAYDYRVDPKARDGMDLVSMLNQDTMANVHGVGLDKSWSKSRLKGENGQPVVTRPPDLRLSVLSKHLDAVDRFVNTAEILSEMDWLIRDPGFSKEFINRFGESRYRQLGEWMATQANPNHYRDPESVKAINRAFNGLRKLNTVSALGMNLKTASKQMLGLFEGANRISRLSGGQASGTMAVLRSIGDFIGNAAKGNLQGDGSPIGRATLHSAEYRAREGSVSHEIRDGLRKAMGEVKTVNLMGKTVGMNDVYNASFALIGMADKLGAAVVWDAQYRVSMAGKGSFTIEPGMTEQQIHDLAVFDANNSMASQASSFDADLTTVQRQKFFNLFNSFISGNIRRFSNAREYYNAWKMEKMTTSDFLNSIVMENGMQVWAGILLASLFGDDQLDELLSGETGEGDKRKPLSRTRQALNWVDALAIQPTANIFEGVPFVRDVSQVVRLDKRTGRPRFNREAFVPSPIKGMLQIPEKMTKAYFSGDATQLGLAGLESAGYAAGVPVGNIRKQVIGAAQTMAPESGLARVGRNVWEGTRNVEAEQRAEEKTAREKAKAEAVKRQQEEMAEYNREREKLGYKAVSGYQSPEQRKEWLDKTRAKVEAKTEKRASSTPPRIGRTFRDEYQKYGGNEYKKKVPATLAEARKILQKRAEAKGMDYDASWEEDFK